MKRRSIIIVVAIVTFALFLSVFSFGKIAIRVKAAAVKKDTLNWIDTIPKLEREPSFQSAFPSPSTHPDAFYEIYEIGYAAAPHLIQYVIDNDMNNMDGAFMVMAAVNNLHLSYLPGAIKPTDENPIYSKDEDAYTPVWYARQLQEFAKEAPVKITEICDSDIPMAEKMLKLEAYGMLAVPILQEKIDSGHTQWNECVLNLSLSALSVEERFDVLAYAFEEETLYANDRDELVHQRKTKALENRDFNESWFDENSDELTLMGELFK